MSRQLSDLTLGMQDKARALIGALADLNVDLLIYCTHRGFEEQARLFRNGRDLATIEKKANELANRWNRPDLAEILMAVGPQHGRKILTYAGPGQSNHNYKLAFDSVPLRDGKPVWRARNADDRMLWAMYGREGEALGLEWSGRWKRFKELPHMQEPGLNWRDLIMEGAGNGIGASH